MQSFQDLYSDFKSRLNQYEIAGEVVPSHSFQWLHRISNSLNLFQINSLPEKNFARNVTPVSCKNDSSLPDIPFDSQENSSIHIKNDLPQNKETNNQENDKEIFDFDERSYSLMSSSSTENYRFITPKASSSTLQPSPTVTPHEEFSANQNIHILTPQGRNIITPTASPKSKPSIEKSTPLGIIPILKNEEIIPLNECKIEKNNFSETSYVNKQKKHSSFKPKDITNDEKVQDKKVVLFLNEDLEESDISSSNGSNSNSLPETSFNKPKDIQNDSCPKNEEIQKQSQVKHSLRAHKQKKSSIMDYIPILKCEEDELLNKPDFKFSKNTSESKSGKENIQINVDLRMINSKQKDTLIINQFESKDSSNESNLAVLDESESDIFAEDESSQPIKNNIQIQNDTINQIDSTENKNFNQKENLETNEISAKTQENVEDDIKDKNDSPSSHQISYYGSPEQNHNMTCTKNEDDFIPQNQDNDSLNLNFDSINGNSTCKVMSSSNINVDSNEDSKENRILESNQTIQADEKVNEMSNSTERLESIEKINEKLHSNEDVQNSPKMIFMDSIDLRDSMDPSQIALLGIQALRKNRPSSVLDAEELSTSADEFQKKWKELVHTMNKAQHELELSGKASSQPKIIKEKEDIKKASPKILKEVSSHEEQISMVEKEKKHKDLYKHIGDEKKRRDVEKNTIRTKTPVGKKLPKSPHNDHLKKDDHFQKKIINETVNQKQKVENQYTDIIRQGGVDPNLMLPKFSQAGSLDVPNKPKTKVHHENQKSRANTPKSRRLLIKV